MCIFIQGKDLLPSVTGSLIINVTATEFQKACFLGLLRSVDY